MGPEEPGSAGHQYAPMQIVQFHRSSLASPAEVREDDAPPNIILQGCWISSFFLSSQLRRGQPVKIMDLAWQMIRLAGLRPDKDIAIDITGLRPGEKLHEELFHESKPLVPTGHPGLLLGSPRTTNLELLGRSLDELADFCSAGRHGDVMRLLRHLVPEYQGEADRDRVSH